MLGLPDNTDVLLALEPEELALRMLPSLVLAWPEGLSIETYLHRFATAYPSHRLSEVREALIEAWTWLEGQAFLVPVSWRPLNTYTAARKLSRTAQKLAKAGANDRLKGRSLVKTSLFPPLREEVWQQFHRGHFDTAVLVAMKAVEVAVREAAGFGPTDIGVDLMRKAFHPDNGPLTDTAATRAEREARGALFAGAIGSYKNPQSHRKVDLNEPDEAAEIILLASHLLRIVNAREIQNLI